MAPPLECQRFIRDGPQEAPAPCSRCWWSPVELGARNLGRGYTALFAAIPSPLALPTHRQAAAKALAYSLTLMLATFLSSAECSMLRAMASPANTPTCFVLDFNCPVRKFPTAAQLRQGVPTSVSRLSLEDAGLRMENRKHSSEYELSRSIVRTIAKNDFYWQLTDKAQSVIDSGFRKIQPNEDEMIRMRAQR